MDNILRATIVFGITGQIIVIPIFDTAIIGYEPVDRRVIYDKEMCVNILTEKNISQDFIENIIAMCKTNRTPLFINTLTN